MKYADCTISKLQPGDSLPFDLLLLADETTEAIEKYIYNSDVYIVKAKGYSRPIAVFALSQVNDMQIEIKNIAVLESLQARGLGSYLLSEIKRIARLGNFKNLIVGTPDCSFKQILFYKKNGFTKYGIRKDFFITNYPEPILENGVILRDMLVLKVDL